MNSNAAGQLAGYAIQFPRALYHLLRSKPGDAVCVEVFGDVATQKADGVILAEEDKSSINSNPLTDRSSDLWKTFANWLHAINDGTLDISKAKFILYANKCGQSGIVNKFSEAETTEEAQESIKYAKKTLRDIKTGHSIFTDYSYVMGNEPLLTTLLLNFELQIGTEAGYDDVRREIRAKHVSETQIDYVMDAIGGWLQREITNKIQLKQSAIITWENYDTQFRLTFERVRLRELLDFTLQNPVKEETIQSHVKNRPQYVQQLDAINLTDDAILEAVADYLRAQVNIHKWIETGTINEAIASDFESKLIRFWEHQVKDIELTHDGLDKEKCGQLVLSRCVTRQETIRGESPPASTIPGLYHTLADKPTIGWHPDWKKIFSKDREL